MSNPFGKKIRGDPMVIPALGYNHMIERSIESLHPRHAARPGLTPQVVIVKNISGSDLGVFNIVSVAGVVVDPDDDGGAKEDIFLFQPAFTVVKPNVTATTLRFGVIQQPIKNNEYGRCVFVGVTVCKVKVIQDWHRYATIKTDEVTYLESAPAGDAIIMWANSAQGEDANWALISIGTGDSNALWGKATTNWNKAVDNGSYVVVNPSDDKDGSNVDVGNTVKVWLPRNGRDLDPNIVADAIVPYQLTNPELDTPEGVCIGEFLDGKIDVSLKMIVSTELDPDGWTEVSDADSKVLVMNQNPPQTGYDTHGGDTNDHDDHTYDLSHDVNDNLTFTPALSSHEFPWWNKIGADPDQLELVLTGHGIDVSGVGSQVLAEGGNLGGDLTVDNHTGSFGHSETSNWPPWYKVKLIMRTDNSV